MNKKVLSILLAMSVAISMTACSKSASDDKDSDDKDVEETIEETTTETLSECEANGHTWVDATCEDPKTCSVCGETDGDALGHDLLDANYQQGPICTVCGEEIGDPITAIFEEMEYECSGVLGETYYVPTTCYTNEDYETVGMWTFDSIDIFESDETHLAVDGYEWQVVKFTAVFNDDNAWEYGLAPGVYTTDYYYTVPEAVDENADNTIYYTGDTDRTGQVYTLNYFGEDYPECYTFFEAESDGWVGHELVQYWTVHFLVPTGYDGNIIAIVNRAGYADFSEQGLVGGVDYTFFDVIDENSVAIRVQ